MNIYPNGLGEVLGDVLATTKPLQTPGFVWFVNSATGVDASGTAGRDRQKPLATLVQAIANAAAGDILLLESGHTETLTTFINVNKQLWIVGGGQSGGIPSVTFRWNTAATCGITLSASNCEVRNILFAESVQANTTGNLNAKIVVANTFTGCRIKGCRFQCNGFDQFDAVQIGTTANSARLENCTFVSTATAVASRPTIGLDVIAANSDLELYGCTFDDGTVGWSTAAASMNVTLTRLRAENISLLRGATMLIGSASTGYANIATSTGGGRATW